MPNYIPVSREHHGTKTWTKFSSYAFAAQSAVAPLVAAELPKAMMSMPIGFVRTPQGYMPAAILSLEPNRNLFVSPQGQWIGGYVPSLFRSYPFRLLPAQQASNMVLCVDEESGLLGEASTGEAIFANGGELTAPAQQVVDFLTQVEGNRVATLRASQALEEYELIKPWPLMVESQNGPRPVEGVFKVDEAALNGLPLESFGALRQAGALVLAYCQMLSMQHVSLLTKLADMQNKAQSKAPSPPMLQNMIAPVDDGDLVIDWSQFNSGSA